MKNVLTQIVAIILFFTGLWFYNQNARMQAVKMDRIAYALDELAAMDNREVIVHVDFNDTRKTQVIRVAACPTNTPTANTNARGTVDLGALLDEATGGTGN